MEQTTPFDTHIQELHAKIEDLQKQMEAVSKQFIEATVAPVATWYRQQVETLVKKDPNHLAALNPDQVKLVKADLQKLIDNAGFFLNAPQRPVFHRSSPGACLDNRIIGQRAGGNPETGAR